MYFIAYISQIKEHRVVPFRWTRGINYENTLNNGLNRNITFHTFWTRDPYAFDRDGVPKFSYAPDPNARGKKFPDDGWYECKVVKFKVAHSEAVAYCNRRRNMPPRVYNAKRLRESTRKRNPRTIDSMNHNMVQVALEPENQIQDVDNQAAARAVQQQPRAAKELPRPAQEQPGAAQEQPRPAQEQPREQQFDEEENTNAGASVQMTPGPESELQVDFSDNAASLQHEPSHVKKTQSLDASASASFSATVPGSNNQPSDDFPVYPNEESLNENENISLDSTVMTRGPECIPEDMTPGPECIPQDMTPGPECIPEDTKPDFEPYHPASRTQNRELSGILSEVIQTPPENDPEDCVIVGETSVFPMPLPSTNEGLVKREMDILSGNMPFTETKNGRIYKIGNRLIEISIEVIERLIFWNTQSQSEEVNLKNDIPFALAILLSVASPDDISKNMVNDDVINFITNLLRLRAKNDNTRVNGAIQAIREYCLGTFRP